MKVKNAILIIKKQYPNRSIMECLEFPEFYGFALVDKGKEKEPFGGGYITINKKDGSTSSFNPTSNIPMFLSAKPVDLKQLQ